MTLYGLPFIRVKVPNPTPPPYNGPIGGSFDPPPQPVDPQVLSELSRANPGFTRVVTLTNIVYQQDAYGSDRVPRVASADVIDSFRPGETIELAGQDWIAAGKPVLPLLTYDITLQNTQMSVGDGNGIPQPRGVRLIDGAMLPEINPYNPHITTITTDTTFVQQQDDPALTMPGIWLPDQPFSYQRTANDSDYTDKLLVSPAQYYGANGESGRLRRFSQMIFEIAYLDPESAPADMLDDTTPPQISDVTISLPSQGGVAPAAQPQIVITASVSDTGTGLAVEAAYSNDGVEWDSALLKPTGVPGTYRLQIDAPANGKNIAVLVTATDKAGNVATYTAKGTLLAYSFLFMPVVRR